MAKRDKGHASSLYLLAYYVGASLMGWSGGWAWRSDGWDGVAAYAAGAFAIVLGIALLLMMKGNGPMQGRAT
jgi:YNFM family putative membrane transporter